MKKAFAFIKSTLSESDGTGSIKRVILLILVMVFCGITIYCHIKRFNPFESFLSDLRVYILYFGGLITGSRGIDAFKEIKITQSNNNANVGVPSPNQAPTIINQ